MDLTGKEFGKYTVLSKSEKKRGFQFWICICECGSKNRVREDHLLGGAKSCYPCFVKRIREEARERHVSSTGKFLYNNNTRLPYVKEFRREQYKKQKGICPICLKSLGRDVCFDHDHNTEECRELVHRGCNVFVGVVEKDPDILSRVGAYLRRHGWNINSE